MSVSVLYRSAVLVIDGYGLSVLYCAASLQYLAVGLCPYLTLIFSTLEVEPCCVWLLRLILHRSRRAVSGVGSMPFSGSSMHDVHSLSAILAAFNSHLLYPNTTVAIAIEQSSACLLHNVYLSQHTHLITPNPCYLQDGVLENFFSLICCCTVHLKSERHCQSHISRSVPVT